MPFCNHRVTGACYGKRVTTPASFVIRILEASPPPEETLRGWIRHVQSGTEARFTCWEDALAFMQRALQTDAAQDAPPPNT
ncbi:MAG: hypothetical protein Fur0018_12450 [Anaerolineales bacterium]